jgi:tetratricopeptide (TPR) repeat protein
MGHEPIDRIDEVFEGHDGLDKAIVIAIVVTLLIAAITALGQMRALKRHDEAVSRADQWVAVASQASFRSDSTAQLELDRFYLAQEARVRSEQARADALLGVGPAFRASADDSNRWNLVYNSLQSESGALVGGTRGSPRGIAGEFGDIQQLTQGSVPEIPQAQLVGTRATCPGVTATWPVQGVPGRVPQAGAESPEQDPNFPSRYVADNRRSVFFLEARGTLASEHAEAEEKQFTRFGVSLTLFATAVFLFGFALSPYGRLHRRLYATGAVVFVVGSSVWAIYAAIAKPPNENVPAAAAYADGQVASTRGTDRLDTATAIAFYKCAIKFDPSFAPAYTNRALALNSLFDPTDPTGGSNTELVDKRDRQLALKDLELAKDHGAADPMLPLVNGTDVFETGLEISNRLNDGKLEQGLQQEQQAAKLLSGSATESQLVGDSRDPSGTGLDGRKAQAAKLLETSTLIAFNIAEAQLSLGHFPQAQRAYATAVELANQQLASADAGAQGYASGALTDLVDIAVHTTVKSEEAIHAHAEQEKNYVVAHLFSESGPSSSVNVSGTVVLPGLAGFRINKGPAFARSHVINAQWYYHSPKGRAWSAFGSEPSGEQGSPNQSLDGFFTEPFVPTTVCLGSGQYMLELYVNGRLANRPSPITVTLPNLAPAMLQDMGVSICRPATGKRQWQPLRAGSPRPGVPTRLAGLVDGYVSPDQRAGILVFDVTPEADRERNGRGTSALLDKALAQLHDWLPGQPSGELPFRFPFLGGSLGSQTRLYAYPGGVISAGIGATGSGRVIVAVVYGPASMFTQGTPPLAADLLGSVVSHE